MKDPLVFRTVNYHKRIISGSTISFFKDEDYLFKAKSVLDMSESELIKWIMKDKRKISLLMAELGLTNKVFVSREVGKPIIEYGEKPGDVDLLLIPNDSFDQCIAIECKRAKVEIKEDESEKVNKIKEIDKGIKQSRSLRDRGFYNSYLLIFIVTDGRNKKSSNVLFRSGDSSPIKELYQLSKREELHPDVGVIFYQITQTGNEHIDMMGDVAVCCDKRAVPVEQTNIMNQRIRLHHYRALQEPHKLLHL